MATRQRILDAAAKVFRHNGYTGTRLSDIATAAHTQAGSLYYHFASREDLVEEVLRVGQARTNEFVMQRVAALPDTASNLDRVLEALSAHLAAVLEIGNYTAATVRILGQVPDEIRQSTLVLQREYGRWWRGLLEAAQVDGDLRKDLDLSACRMLLLGAMNAAPDWFDPKRPGGTSTSDLERHFAAIFLDGLATTQGRRRVPRTVAVDLERHAAPPQEHETRGAATTERILDAAARVFREHGYAGGRLSDVAQAAHMQTGSLYYHFSSREDLVSHLLRDAWRRTDTVVRRSVEELPSRSSSVTRLSTAITAHLLSVLGDGDYTSAMLRILGQVPDDVRAGILPLQRQYLDLWRGLLESGVRAGDVRSDLDPSVTLLIVQGALNWTVEWFDRDGHLTPESLAALLCLVVFKGMRSGPDPLRPKSSKES